ncbi:MAG: hypothetical protein HKN09_12410 [Saprospiraceae bacterium]|nr:hypothetical protein [Saprospiraceae bacterium]
MKLLTTLILVVFVSALGFSQVQTTSSHEDLAGPTAHLQYFKSLPLIVRLNLKQKTLDAYKKQIELASSEDNKASYQADYDELKSERQDYVKYVKSAFEKFYFFSEVYFINDHDYKDFKSGKLGLLFSADGQKIDISQNQAHMLLVQGENDLHWIMMSSEEIPFPKAFPREYKSGFKRVLNLFVAQKDANQEDMDKAAQTINERLFKYENKLKKRQK